MTKIRYLFCFIGTWLVGTAAWSQGRDVEEISIGRPDQSRAASALNPGRLQLEAGLQFTEDKHPEGYYEREWVYPDFEIRYGLFEGVEISAIGTWGVTRPINAEGLDLKIARGAVTRFGVGTVIDIYSKDQFSLAALGFLLGSPQDEGVAVLPELYLSGAYTITDRWRLGSTVGWVSQPDHSPGDLSYTLSVGLRIGRRLRLFVEPYGDIEGLEDFNLRFNGGGSYLITPNFQVDASAGRGINTSGYFVGIGLTARFFRSTD